MERSALEYFMRQNVGPRCFRSGGYKARAIMTYSQFSIFPAQDSFKLG